MMYAITRSESKLIGDKVYNGCTYDFNIKANKQPCEEDIQEFSTLAEAKDELKNYDSDVIVDEITEYYITEYDDEGFSSVVVFAEWNMDRLDTYDIELVNK